MLFFCGGLLAGCQHTPTESNEDDFSQKAGVGSWELFEADIPSDQVGVVEHVSAWSGNELLLWGGGGCDPAYDCGGGARLEPVTDSWKEMSNAGAPSPRRKAQSAWTGEEMLVWGGHELAPPEAEEWDQVLGNGAAYRPETDTWRALSNEGVPAPRSEHRSVWTEDLFIVWGGSSLASITEGMLDTGGIYDPAIDAWTAMSPAPSARVRFSAIWTGTEMIIWGGDSPAEDNLATGMAYGPATDSWRALSQDGAPEGRVNHSALWTGREMIVIGGLGCSACSTGAYDPESDSWRTIEGGPPFGRSAGSAVWSGERVMVWNGSESRSDAILDPATDTWERITDVGNPPRRDLATVHWTGSSMVVWGGMNHLSVSDSGGLFTP